MRPEIITRCQSRTFKALELALVEGMISPQRVHAPGNFDRLGHSIDQFKQTLALVIRYKGHRLFSICSETSSDSFGIVVGTPSELLAATPIAGVCRGRSIELVMVACPAAGACKTATDTIDQSRLVNLDLYDQVDPTVLVFQQTIERLCLGYGTRETIHQKARATVVSRNSLSNHFDQDFIWDQMPFVHDFLRRKPNRCSRNGGGPQHIAGR